MEAAYFDLGSYGRRASTSSTGAQTWFDRGLVWSYGFNHEEAVRCFEEAIALDDGFALAHWGVAYAAGPNYNKDWDAFDAVDLRASLRKAHDASVRGRRARRRRRAGRARADRGAARTASRRPSRCRTSRPGRSPTPTRWSASTPTIPTTSTSRRCYADALMNITAWALWDVATGEPAEGARTLEAKAVLDAALARPGRHAPSRPAAPVSST